LVLAEVFDFTLVFFGFEAAFAMALHNLKEGRKSRALHHFG